MTVLSSIPVRLISMSEAFERLVVEVDMGELDLAGRERVDVDTESVVLGCDHHLSRL